MTTWREARNAIPKVLLAAGENAHATCGPYARTLMGRQS